MINPTVTLDEFAALLGVSRSTISVIRRTFPATFPQPIGGRGNRPHEYDEAEARAYASRYFEHQAQELAEQARILFARSAELGGVHEKE